MIPTRIPREELSPGRRDLPRPPSPLPADPVLRTVVQWALNSGLPLTSPEPVISAWAFSNLSPDVAPLAKQNQFIDRLVRVFSYGARHPQEFERWLAGPEAEPDEAEEEEEEPPVRHPLVSDRPSPIIFAHEL